MKLLLVCMLSFACLSLHAQHSVVFGKGKPGRDDFEQLCFYRSGTIVYTHGKNLQMHRLSYKQAANVLNLEMKGGNSAAVTIRKKKLEVAMHTPGGAANDAQSNLYSWLPKDASQGQGVEYGNGVKSATEAIAFVRRYFY